MKKARTREAGDLVSKLREPLENVVKDRQIINILQKLGYDNPRIVDLLYAYSLVKKSLVASGGVEAASRLELTIHQIIDYLTDGEPFIPANKLLESGNLGLAIVPTESTLKLGVDEFDREFGALRYASIHMFAGVYGVGKTQICFQYAVRAFLPAEEGGLVSDGKLPKVFYIDTEARFSCQRILKIARRWEEGLRKTVGSVEKILDHIHVARISAACTGIICSFIDKISRYVEPGEKILIVLDSLAAPVYYSVDSEHSPRQALEYAQLYRRILRRLLNIAQLYGAIILTTMHVYTDLLHGGKYVIKGGTVVGHGVMYIFTVEKIREDTRRIRCVKSPEHENFEVTVKICEDGLR